MKKYLSILILSIGLSSYADDPYLIGYNEAILQSVVVAAYPDGSWTQQVFQAFATLDDGILAKSAIQPAQMTNYVLSIIPTVTNGVNGIAGSNGLNTQVALWGYTNLAFPNMGYVLSTNIANTNYFYFALTQGNPGTTGAAGASGSNGTNATPAQRIRVQTNGSGIYTWTYTTLYSTTPVISVAAEGLGTTCVNVQITSVTTSNASFQVFSLPTQTILGISVGVPTATQAFIDAYAIAQ